MQSMRTFFVLSSLVFFGLALSGCTQNPDTAKSSVPTAAEHDGQHDFDPLIGSWKAHLKRRLHPLTGSNEWAEFDATIVYKTIWDGRANYSEFESTNAEKHIEGVTLRTYNPKTHQWSLYWANSKDGLLAPPQVGEFRNGRGEFFAEDTLDGKTILVRYVWSNLSTSPHFEQSFSDDGGQSWELNWVSDQTRIPDDSVPSESAHESPAANAGAQAPGAAQDGQRDFDPLLGSWKFHLKRRLKPLTGSNTWVDLNGTGVCYKVWGGRANLDTVELDGSTGHIEGLTLRTYNPENQEWRLYWANSKDGLISVPQVGHFKNGHGEFYAQDTVNGKTIFVKFDWSRMNSDAPHFEQSFSDDGGKTWEANWLTDQTRVGERSH